MRSFSLVLLRRLLFRPAANQPQRTNTPASPRLTLFDILSPAALSTLERLLLHALAHEPSQPVRRKAVDTVCDLANNAMSRGRPWHALQAQAFAMAQGADPGLREAAFRVFAGCPNLVMDLQTDAVLGVFQKGLQDAPSVEVRVSYPHLSHKMRSIPTRFAMLHFERPSHTLTPPTPFSSRNVLHYFTRCLTRFPRSHQLSLHSSLAHLPHSLPFTLRFSSHTYPLSFLSSQHSFSPLPIADPPRLLVGPSLHYPAVQISPFRLMVLPQQNTLRLNKIAPPKPQRRHEMRHARLL
jgi:hypothetical protein